MIEYQPVKPLRVAMTLNTATQSQPEEKFLLREKAKESSADLVAFYIRV